MEFAIPKWLTWFKKNVWPGLVRWGDWSATKGVVPGVVRQVGKENRQMLFSVYLCVRYIEKVK